MILGEAGEGLFLQKTDDGIKRSLEATSKQLS